jgi:hypothetical protein
LYSNEVACSFPSRYSRYSSKETAPSFSIEAFSALTALIYSSTVYPFIRISFLFSRLKNSTESYYSSLLINSFGLFSGTGISFIALSCFKTVIAFSRSTLVLVV